MGGRRPGASRLEGSGGDLVHVEARGRKRCHMLLILLLLRGRRRSKRGGGARRRSSPSAHGGVEERVHVNPVNDVASSPGHRDRRRARGLRLVRGDGRGHARRGGGGRRPLSGPARADGLAPPYVHPIQAHDGNGSSGGICVLDEAEALVHGASELSLDEVERLDRAKGLQELEDLVVGEVVVEAADEDLVRSVWDGGRHDAQLGGIKGGKCVRVELRHNGWVVVVGPLDLDLPHPKDIDPVEGQDG